MDEAITLGGTPVMQGLFEGIENEPGMSCAAGAPPDNTAGERVDYEGDVNEALPSGDVGEV